MSTGTRPLSVLFHNLVTPNSKSPGAEGRVDSSTGNGWSQKDLFVCVQGMVYLSTNYLGPTVRIVNTVINTGPNPLNLRHRTNDPGERGLDDQDL